MTDTANGHVRELWPTYYLQDATVTTTESRRGQGVDKAAVALIILNCPISDLDYFRTVYSNACFCVCADAGADRLHDLLVSAPTGGATTWEDQLKTALPDLIHGDLDSLSAPVRKRYEHLGVEVSRDPDQYSTDFGKAVNKVIERLPDVKEILVSGSLGGRVDQGVGLLHELYRAQKYRHPDIRFWLFSEASVTVMLRPGSTVIHTPLEQGLIERNIGILPVYGPAVISTKGLEWDVEEWKTEMGGQVSTSNHIVDDRVHVTTDVEVLFTVERTRASHP